VRQQDIHDKREVQLKLFATLPPPFFHKQHFYISLSTRLKGLRMMSPPWLPRFQTTSTSCDLDLWPPDPRGRPFMSLLRGKIYANLHWNRFVRFRSIVGNRWKSEQTDKRTDEGTGREHYASGQCTECRLAYG